MRYPNCHNLLYSLTKSRFCFLYRIKSLHSQLSEKSAKIRLLQNNNEELENDDEPKEPEWPLDPAFCRTDFAHIKDLARDSCKYHKSKLMRTKTHSGCLTLPGTISSRRFFIKWIFIIKWSWERWVMEMTLVVFILCTHRCWVFWFRNVAYQSNRLEEQWAGI